MTLSEPTRRTLRHSFLAFAAGYCAVFVACQEANVETCPSGLFCPAGSHCAARQDVCIFTPCGNGKLDSGEVCDDGTLVDGDGCSSTCRSNETCGNGIIDWNAKVPEECDWSLDSQHCSSQCKSMRCGNGIPEVDLGEQCDPGPNGTTAQCLASCKWSVHGDGWVNPLHENEQCDGDGLGSVTPGNHGPACEFAGTVAGTYHVCNSDCTPGYHGDGKVNRSDGEVCDGSSDGVPTGRADCESLTCNWNCTPGSCRDGVPNHTAGETCDDGNENNFDDCTNACTTNECGDGIRQTSGSRVEECDSGSGNVDPSSLPTCDYGQTCTFCLQLACMTATVVGPHCGDGEVQYVPARNALEECDDPVSATSCGTCVGCRWVYPTNAHGAIDVKVASSIVAGDTITVDDGTTSAVLEFSDSVNQCTTTARSCVHMMGVHTKNQAANAIRNAMLAPEWTSSVTPVSGTGNPISLRHASDGFAYNRPITVDGSSVAVAPAGGAVVVNGMTGGAGCLLGEACASSWDCVGSLACSDDRFCQ